MPCELIEAESSERYSPTLVSTFAWLGGADEADNNFPNGLHRLKHYCWFRNPMMRLRQPLWVYSLSASSSRRSGIKLMIDISSDTTPTFAL